MIASVHVLEEEEEEEASEEGLWRRMCGGGLLEEDMLRRICGGGCLEAVQSGLEAVSVEAVLEEDLLRRICGGLEAVSAEGVEADVVEAVSEAVSEEAVLEEVWRREDRVIIAMWTSIKCLPLKMMTVDAMFFTGSAYHMDFVNWRLS